MAELLASEQSKPLAGVSRNPDEAVHHMSRIVANWQANLSHRFHFGHVSKMCEAPGVQWVLIMQIRLLLNHKS